MVVGSTGSPGCKIMNEVGRVIAACRQRAVRGVVCPDVVETMTIVAELGGAL